MNDGMTCSRRLRMPTDFSPTDSWAGGLLGTPCPPDALTGTTFPGLVCVGATARHTGERWEVTAHYAGKP